MIKKNYNGLFRRGPNPAFNACVGTNGGPYDFSAYAEGFFQAGNAIIESAKNGSTTIDLVLYPAAYSYRQGIELYIKHFIRIIELYNNDGIIKASGHDLLDLWNKLITELNKIELPIIDPTENGIAHDIIEEFQQIDKNGEVFRYPEDKKRNLHLKDKKLINIDILKQGMDVLFELFEDIESSLSRLENENKKPQ